MYRYSDYPRVVCEDIVRLRRCIARSGILARKTDDSLIIGTWNIRQFGTVFPSGEDNPGSPKRNGINPAEQFDRTAAAEESDLIVLGDFNVDRRRLEDPLYAAFVASGLTVPEALRDVQSNYGQTVKHYDQIAWFMGDLSLLTKGAAGVIDFRGAVFKEFSPRQVTDRLSDHLPLWVEFLIDRSTERLATALGLNAAAPDPFVSILD